MYCYRLTFLISALLMALAAFAQDYPTASPKMIIDTEDGEEENQACPHRGTLHFQRE